MVVSVVVLPAPSDDARFVKFKREMLPKVGQKITVVGTLSVGKQGFWLAFNGWGAEIYATKESSIKKQNELDTRFHGGETVKATGTLRYFPDQHSTGRDSKGNHVQVPPEHFFFDVAEITISPWSRRAAKHPK